MTSIGAWASAITLHFAGSKPEEATIFTYEAEALAVERVADARPPPPRRRRRRYGAVPPRCDKP